MGTLGGEMDDRHDPFVRAGSVGDPMTARVAVAILESLGIDCLPRGQSSGEFPVTVGRMAETEIWVRRSDLGAAEAALDEIRRRSEPGAGARTVATRPAVSPALATAVAITLGLAVVVTAMRLF